MASKLVWFILVFVLIISIPDSNSKDIKRKCALTNLYNKRVIEVEYVERPKENKLLKICPHAGVRLDRIYH